MKKVYTGKLLSNTQHIPLLYPNLGLQTRPPALFFDVFSGLTNKNNSVVEIVDNVEKADYLLIPHNYSKIKLKKLYIENFVRLSRQYNKKIIIFAYGDYSGRVNIPNSIIFRSSEYRSELTDNEIIIPAYSEDLGELYGFDLRNKIGDRKPVIGFCGWAGFSTLKQTIKTHIKDIVVTGRGVCIRQKNVSAHKNGVFMRKKILTILDKVLQVKTNFIVRTSFSRRKTTIELDPHEARKEYIQVLKDSDFGLAVKGDGNFSVRFYEILSLAGGGDSMNTFHVAVNRSGEIA